MGRWCIYLLLLCFIKEMSCQFRLDICGGTSNTTESYLPFKARIPLLKVNFDGGIILYYYCTGLRSCQVTHKMMPISNTRLIDFHPPDYNKADGPVFAIYSRVFPDDKDEDYRESIQQFMRVPLKTKECRGISHREKFAIPRLSLSADGAEQAIYPIGDGKWVNTYGYDQYARRCWQDQYHNARQKTIASGRPNDPNSISYYVRWYLQGHCPIADHKQYKSPDDCDIKVSSIAGIVRISITDKILPEGHVTVFSDVSTASLYCEKMPCVIKIQSDSYVKVTCPSGASKEYVVKKDLTEDCPLAQYSSIRGAALHVCRSTAWPIAFWLLIATVLIGQWVLLALNWSGVYIYALIRKACVRRRIAFLGSAIRQFRPNDDEEAYIDTVEPILVCCTYCEEEFSNDDFTKVLHNVCKTNTCPYCGTNVMTNQRETFIKHVSKCPKKKETVRTAQAASGKVIDDWRTINNVNRLTQYQWILCIFAAFFWCISPVYGEQNELIRPAVMNAWEDLDDTQDPIFSNLSNKGYDSQKLIKELDDLVSTTLSPADHDTFYSDQEPFGTFTAGAFETKTDISAHMCGRVCDIINNECTCGKAGYFPADQAFGATDINDLRNVVAKGYIHPHLQSYRSDAISWTSTDEDEEGVIKLSGLFNGYLGMKDHLYFRATHKRSKDERTISVYVKEYFVTYSFTTKAVIYNRELKMEGKWSCLAPCSYTDHDWGFNTTSPNGKIMEFTGINRGSHMPGSCWNIGGGCIKCGLQALINNNQQVIIQGTVGRPVLDYTVCLVVDSKEVCVNEEDAATLYHPAGVKVTLSGLPKDTERIRENDIIYTSIGSPDGSWIMESSPTFFTSELIPDTLPAPHGRVGDTFADNLLPITIPGKGTLRANLGEVQINYHQLMWASPGCNFNGAVESIREPFFNIMYNKDGRSPRLNVRKSNIQRNEEMVKGTVSFNVAGTNTIQVVGEVNDLVLGVSHIVIQSISSMKLSDCKGYLGTLEGFNCSVILEGVRVNGDMAIKFTAPDQHIILTDNIYTLTDKIGRYEFYVWMVVLEKNDQIKLCVKGNDTICASSNMKVIPKPGFNFGLKENLFRDSTTGNGKECSGLAWFECAWDSTVGFFTNIWASFKQLWWVFMIIVISVIIIICLVLLTKAWGKFRQNDDKKIKERIEKELANLEDDDMDEDILANVIRGSNSRTKKMKEFIETKASGLGDKLKPALAALNERKKIIKAALKRKNKSA